MCQFPVTSPVADNHVDPAFAEYDIALVVADIKLLPDAVKIIQSVLPSGPFELGSHGAAHGAAGARHRPGPNRGRSRCSDCLVV